MVNKKTIDDQQVSISLATEVDFFEIKNFLKRHKESSANRNDRNYIVRYENRLIGIAKLIIVSDNVTTEKYWLRGLYIDDSFRNLGLGSSLLKFIFQNLTEKHVRFEILAFPHLHLESFYMQNSYQPIDPTELPMNLQERYQKAKRQQKDWLCMQCK